MFLLFDIGGVVLTLGEPNANLAHTHAFERAFGVAPGVFQDLNKVWYEVWAQYNHGRISEDEFWREYLTRAGARNVDATRAAQLYRELTKPVPGTIELMAELKNKGVRLAALTNMGRESLQFQREMFKLDDYFSPIIASCDLGMAKPEPAIYEHALRQLNAPARDVVFIDNHERNLPPAQALGMKTILFSDAQHLKGELEKYDGRLKRKL